MCRSVPWHRRRGLHRRPRVQSTTLVGAWRAGGVCSPVIHSTDSTRQAGWADAIRGCPGVTWPRVDHCLLVTPVRATTGANALVVLHIFLSPGACPLGFHARFYIRRLPG